jgi:hypothetical protein
VGGLFQQAHGLPQRGGEVLICDQDSRSHQVVEVQSFHAVLAVMDGYRDRDPELAIVVSVVKSTVKGGLGQVPRAPAR